MIIMFALDSSLALVLICTNFSSVMSSSLQIVDYLKLHDSLQDSLQVWSKTKDNLNNLVWS